MVLYGRGFELDDIRETSAKVLKGIERVEDS
jgi:hypothetical protein